MASLVVSGDTSGAITLSAPSVAGTNTLSLPAQTATLATLTTPSFATTIGVGGATAAASGAGITFPASQSASSNANTLDDYEEGTWTGTMLGATTNPSSPVTATGTYTKIGRLVYLQIEFSNKNTTGASGPVRISGIPFSATGSEIYVSGGSVSAYNFDFSGRTNITTQVYSQIALYVSGTNTTWVELAHNAGSGRYLGVSSTYIIPT